MPNFEYLILRFKVSFVITAIAIVGYLIYDNFLKGFL